jgi:hypothetical protein
MGTTVRLIRARGSVRLVAIRLAVYSLLVYLTAGTFFYSQQGKLLFPAPKNSRNAVSRGVEQRAPATGSDDAPPGAGRRRRASSGQGGDNGTRMRRIQLF